MSLAVDIIFILIVASTAYSGARHGVMLMALELTGFIVATATALATYPILGGWIKQLAGITLPLGKVVSFVLIWIIAELCCTLIVRFVVLPHLHPEFRLAPASWIGGSILGTVKALLWLSLGLILFIGLPVSAAFKTPITDAELPRAILQSTGRVQVWLASGLGHDLADSLNFFTVTTPNNPESEERIELGFTTNSVKVDSSDEDAMLVLVNNERTSRGMVALKMNDKARTVAREYSVDLFARGYFSHISLEGKTPFDRMKAGGVKYGAAGENLALAPTLTLAHQGLMNSPGHRANILNPDYRTVGIGIMDGGQYGLMVTQDFTD